MLELLVPIFGFLIGIIAALTGIGGGAFIVSLLALAYEFSPANAVGTSLTAIIFTAIAATINYSRQKRIYYKTGLALTITTVPGASLGAYLTTILPPNWLGIILGIMLIPIALHMIIDFSSVRKKRSNTEEKESRFIANSDSELLRSKEPILIGMTLCFLAGLGSGLLGVGGGVFIVPIMTLAMGMPIHFATATSMFTMIFTTISGVTQHYLAGHISFEFALLLATGAVFGAQAGAYASKRISNKSLLKIFGATLIVVSIEMIRKYL